MTVQGTIRGGLVILSEAIEAPDGTPVTVLLPSTDANAAKVTAAEHEQRTAALAELLAIPNENPGDTFSGADHDQVLYGDRP